MEFKELKSNLQEEECSINISKTAYRALLVAKLLSTKPMNKEEIIEELKNNPITKNSSSFDSFRLTLNTLKALGCEFNRPSILNHYTYFMTKSPFGLEIKDYEADILNNIRQNLTYFNDWQLLFKINLLYRKIAKLSNNENTEEIFLNHEPLRNIKLTLFLELLSLTKDKRTIEIQYKSGSSDNSRLKIKLDHILYENGHLYFCAYTYKHNEYAYLEVENLKNINKIYMNEEFNENENPLIARYKINSSITKEFILNTNEKIIEQNKNYTIIEATVYSKFIFLQRILSFGNQCELLSPQNLREELINKLKQIHKRYSDGKK